MIQKKAPEIVHNPEVVRLAAGSYQARCLKLGAVIGCGWEGGVHDGVGRWAKRAAEAEADLHAGRTPEATGTTPNRPMRIPDSLWNAVLEVAKDEGVTASEVWRQAGAADPRIAAKLEQVSA